MKALLYLLIAACCAGCASMTPDAAATATEPPFYAPDFALDTLNGERIRLNDLRGAHVIINFWATWCEPCRVEMPDLDALARQYAGELVVLGVNVRESSSLITTFLNDVPVSFPILVNPPDSVLTDYVVIGLPQTLLIDPEGIVIFRTFGPIERAAFIEVLNDALTS